MALGYLLDKYTPQQQSVVGDLLGDRFPGLDRAASVVIGGSLAIATSQAYQPPPAPIGETLQPVCTSVFQFHGQLIIDRHRYCTSL